MAHLQISVFASAPAAPPAIGSWGMGDSAVQAQGATGFSLLVLGLAQTSTMPSATLCENRPAVTQSEKSNIANGTIFG